MLTTKRRLNISLTKELDQALAHVAERDNMPQATKASQLLARALEVEEDIVWDTLAQSRDTKNAKFVNHKKAWA